MAELSLDDKYTSQSGTVVMSGIQALVRLTIDQHRRDAANGLRTATLVSGYRGSPLGGLDQAFERAKSLLDKHDVRFLHGVNEDLAATAIYGSQLAHNYDGPRFDGVVGMWYGKGPGVDRTGDAFRHANVAGVGRNGGVLAVAGDDPSAKSSTVASASEFSLVDVGMPVLYPGSVQEILELGLAGFALSRFCGSWVGLKIVTNVADAFSTVELSPPDGLVLPPVMVKGRPWSHVQNPKLLAPSSLDQEREMHEGRSVAIREFLAANRVNRLESNPADAWLGIVAAGKTYRDVIEALDQMGLTIDDAAALGVRILKLGAIHPIEPSIARAFARDLHEIVVVEEKRAFVELYLRDALYGTAHAPRIVGKFDEAGQQLFPGHGELDADQIRTVLRSRISNRVAPERLRPERTATGAASSKRLIPLSPADVRTPYFCSGCPHNRSTVVPEGSIANGAVGCSTMAMWMDRDTDNILQMGAEGVHWVGAAPFSETGHIFQNMGDGTFLHSGSLAIRQAVAAGTNITFKLLYNAAVAMTGGQPHDADLGLDDIVRSIQAEGVNRILVVSDQPDVRRPDMPAGIEVWHRDRVIEAQEQLRSIEGVTVMVYDQACAADLRRKRKRGQATTPDYRIFINEAVCEGCGDCGVKSNCLSVQPVETVFGRKTQIHQASCNFDETCTTGHCPAFVKVVPIETPRTKRPRRVSAPSGELQEPVRLVDDTSDILMTGIGGTGVVTVNQILGVAARLEGKFSTGLDQTGLAQKGGSVVSHLRVATVPLDGSNIVGVGGADVLLAFDAITAAQERNLARLHPDRTRAVLNTAVAPTGSQVRDVHAVAPSLQTSQSRIASVTRPDELFEVDADATCEALFGGTGPSNIFVVGVAYQRGLLPLSADSIEQAIALNGTAVETNVAAFRAGRMLVLNPDRPEDAPAAKTEGVHVNLSADLRTKVEKLPVATHPLVAASVVNLMGFQDVALAHRYLDELIEIANCELPGRYDLTTAAAKSLHRLLAYKDEYEVARLHRDAAFHAAVGDRFGRGASVTYLLQPPALDRLGVRRKIGISRPAAPMFAALAGAKRLRGTWADPFGRTAHRRMERGLADEYRAHIRVALNVLRSASDQHSEVIARRYAVAVELLACADQVRGFDHVKEANVEAWRREAAQLLENLETQTTITVPSTSLN